jgi:hypothetical protein
MLPLSPSVPTSLPWLVLACDAGLGTRSDGGLVFAVWLDGTIVRQAPGDQTATMFELAALNPVELHELSAVVRTSGIETRKSGNRYLDLPEDGLVIREPNSTPSWYSTPGWDVTPGFAQIAQAVSRLVLKTPVTVKLEPAQWLRWSHYWEKACRS